MTLTDLASIGSFISGIGVIISLVYLGYQTRQSSLTHRASGYQGRMDFIRGQIAGFRDPEMTRLMLRIHQGDETLTDTECMRFHIYQSEFFVGIDHLVWLHDSKILDDDAFEKDCIQLSTLLSEPGIQASWELVRPIASAGTQKLVAQLLANPLPRSHIPTPMVWRQLWRERRAAAAAKQPA